MCVLRYIYINNSGIYNNTNADNIKKSINKDYYYYYNKSNNIVIILIISEIIILHIITTTTAQVYNETAH